MPREEHQHFPFSIGEPAKANSIILGDAERRGLRLDQPPGDQWREHGVTTRHHPDGKDELFVGRVLS